MIHYIGVSKRKFDNINVLHTLKAISTAPSPDDIDIGLAPTWIESKSSSRYCKIEIDEMANEVKRISKGGFSKFSDEIFETEGPDSNDPHSKEWLESKFKLLKVQASNRIKEIKDICG